MKKFVIVMLVLGMATAANATLSLTVNGQPAPDSLTLAPSDTIELDVEAAAGLIGGQFSIVLSNSQGALDWSNIGLATQFDLTGTGYMYNYDLPWRLTPGSDPQPHDVTIDGGNFTSPIPFPEILVWDLIFHCEEATDVEIQLFSDGLVTSGGDVLPGTLLDSIYVVQPEPATIALLGLGGLLLRRRK